MSYRCCKACAEAGRQPYQSARYHADEAARLGKRATRWLCVAGALIAMAAVLQIVAAVAR